MAHLRFQSTIRSFPDFAGIHYIEISRPNIKRLGGKFSVRLVCTINGKLRYQCRVEKRRRGFSA